MFPPSMEPGRAPLVGRARELAVVAEAAARAQAGESQIVFIEGEPGLGKTRLLEAAVSDLAARGWTVLRGDADDLPSPPPHGPFVAALRSWSDTHGNAAMRAAAGAWVRPLASVLPELEPADVKANRKLPASRPGTGAATGARSSQTTTRRSSPRAGPN